VHICSQNLASWKSTFESTRRITALKKLVQRTKWPDVSTACVRLFNACLTCNYLRCHPTHTRRTSVFGRRTLPVLCSTCIWRVTRYRVNRPLQVSQLSQLSLSSSQGRLMSSKLQSYVRCGGAIWWMHTGWRPGVVDWCSGVFACCCREYNCSLARAMDGRISDAAPLALADQLPLLMIVKRGWSGFPVRCTI